MRRFFVPAGSVRGGQVSLGAETAHRLARVLRLRPGDHLILADGERDYEVELTAVSPRAVAARVLGERDPPPAPAVELVLYQSLIRPNRFDLVLEKGTELGVARFVPVVSARSQVRPRGEPGRAQRWRRLVTEAAEQCGRPRPPAVEPPLAFERAVEGAPGLRLLPWEGERTLGLGPFLRSLRERPERVSLFIGPEGGFDRAEVELARRQGAALVSLGPRILRSETAGIVAAALVLFEVGELG